MADILIRGMEMPTNVYDCPLNTFGFCNLAHDSNHIYCIGDSRPEWCPLVPLPEGHGRLGDLDAPIRIACHDGTIRETTPSRFLCEHSLLDLPKTIVPAEGGTDE